MATVSQAMIISGTDSGSNLVSVNAGSTSVATVPSDGYTILTIVTVTGSSPLLTLTDSTPCTITPVAGMVLYIGARTVVTFSAPGVATLGYSASAFTRAS